MWSKDLEQHISNVKELKVKIIKLIQTNGEDNKAVENMKNQLTISCMLPWDAVGTEQAKFNIPKKQKILSCFLFVNTISPLL